MQELLNAMASDGVVISGFQPDGEMHRAKSLWAIAWQNITQSGTPFLVAMYGDWKGGREFKFTSNVRLDRQDKARVNEQIAQAKRAQAEAKAKSHAEAAVNALLKFESLPEGGEPTSYLASKGITELYGARSDGWSIVIPMRDVSGKLWSIQTVDEQTKLYFDGGRVKGCFHVVGELSSPIYLTEGFATAVSVHLATGKGVVCAFDCGNLLPVGEAIKTKHKDAELIICGDDDLWSTRVVNGQDVPYNGGREKAEAAATKLFARVVFPRFQSLDGKPTDFNDLHVREGLDAVRSQVTAAVLPAAIDWTASVQTIDQLEHRDLTAILPHWNWSRPTERNPESRPTTPMATVDNFRALFKSLGVTIRYNMISKTDEVYIPGLVTTLDNHANVVLAHIQSWCERLKIKTGNLNGYVTALSDENAYNPIADWIASKPWDGKDRLADFYATVTAVGEKAGGGDAMERQALKERLLYVWLLQAVAALYRPCGVSAAGILVFLGDQYLGKTKWFKSLLPDHLAAYRADGVTLNVADKDSIFNVISHWLVELGELDATFRRSDIAQLKAFVTRDRDKIRRPYAKAESEYARRTVFFASVNEPKFLNDPTGNRRFWTIDCEAIDHSHQIDMQQLWAQMAVEYGKGVEFYLRQDEVTALNQHNEQFEQVNPIEELLRLHFNWSVTPAAWTNLMTATEIAISIGLKITSVQKEPTSVANALKKKFGLTSKHDGHARRFRMPPRIRDVGPSFNT